MARPEERPEAPREGVNAEHSMGDGDEGMMPSEEAAHEKRTKTRCA